MTVCGKRKTMFCGEISFLGTAGFLKNMYVCGIAAAGLSGWMVSRLFYCLLFCHSAGPYLDEDSLPRVLGRGLNERATGGRLRLEPKL